MRGLALFGAISLVVSACGSGSEPAADSAAGGNEGSTPADPSSATAPMTAPRWDLQSNGEGVSLMLLAESGATTLRLYCPAAGNQLLVNVPAFRPIGSEERLSFGGGGEVVALVADTGGDRQRGGVSGTGAVPANLAQLVGGRISASYGAQSSGPHPAPPAGLARGFIAACGQRPSAPAPAPAPTDKSASPCLMQGSERLSITPLRAVGTEPFWGARIEGRCVTYSHPEDQQGTRVWTRYSPSPGGGVWSGALGGRRFEFRTRDAPGCSDGMSDRRYPIAVELIVNGEQRRGCAEPISG
ncbi:MAG TPA: hypothetical protein VFO69_05705 [Allosphingosinicella sp.]|nr:hypothetical protein [Allosphingosinicella sp.]